MEHYEDIIEKTLDNLMTKYECDDPLEALVLYAVEYENELIKDIEAKNGDVEKEFKQFDREINLFNMECTVDPEKSMIQDTVIRMIENYDKTRIRRCKD